MIVKNYGVINESAARAAKRANSFSDYIEGSATEGYKKQVDECYEIACKAAEKRPKEEERIQRLFDRFVSKLADNVNAENRNRASCPSVMIAGASNFPVHKKEKQNARSEKLMEEYNYIMEIPDKIRSIGNNTTIYSDEDDAIEQLEEKAEKCRETLELMKRENAYYRKNKTMRGFENLSDEEADKIDKRISEGYSWEKKPNPDYMLSSVREKMKKARERAEKLRAIKEQPAEECETVTDVCTIVENSEAMRIQLIFDGKPSEEIRSILKSHGFRWSPRYSAWQRQLTPSGQIAAQKAIKEIKAIEQED